MPLVHVYWNSRRVSQAVVQRVIAVLPEAVSHAMSVSPESSFPSSEVTVVPFEAGRDLGPAPITPAQLPMSRDIQVIIWGHLYPERDAAKDKIANEIAYRLRMFIPGSLSGFVWVLLQPSGFVSFGAVPEPASGSATV